MIARIFLTCELSKLSCHFIFSNAIRIFHSNVNVEYIHVNNMWVPSWLNILLCFDMNISLLNINTHVLWFNCILKILKRCTIIAKKENAQFITYIYINIHYRTDMKKIYTNYMNCLYLKKEGQDLVINNFVLRSTRIHILNYVFSLLNLSFFMTIF